MYKLSDLIGKEAITLSDAKKQGVIFNAHFDDALRQCKYFTLINHDEEIRWVDCKNVLSLEKDAVVIRSPFDVAEFVDAATVPSPINLKAFNQDGVMMGFVRDVEMENGKAVKFITDSGEIASLTLLSISDEILVFNDTGKPLKIAPAKKPLSKRAPSGKKDNASMRQAANSAFNAFASTSPVAASYAMPVITSIHKTQSDFQGRQNAGQTAEQGREQNFAQTLPHEAPRKQTTQAVEQGPPRSAEQTPAYGQAATQQEQESRQSSVRITGQSTARAAGQAVGQNSTYGQNMQQWQGMAQEQNSQRGHGSAQNSMYGQNIEQESRQNAAHERSKAHNVSYTQNIPQDIQKIPQDKTAVHRSPQQQTASKYSFLLGKRLQRNIYDSKGTVIARENDLITELIINRVKDSGKLVTLALHSL